VALATILQPCGPSPIGLPSPRASGPGSRRAARCRRSTRSRGAVRLREARPSDTTLRRCRWTGNVIRRRDGPNRDQPRTCIPNATRVVQKREWQAAREPGIATEVSNQMLASLERLAMRDQGGARLHTARRRGAGHGGPVVRREARHRRLGSNRDRGRSGGSRPSEGAPGRPLWVRLSPHRWVCQESGCPVASIGIRHL